MTEKISNDNLKVCSICGGVFEQVLPYLNIAYLNAPELQDIQIAICNNCGIGAVFPEKSWNIMQKFYERSYRSKGSVHRNAARPLASKYSVSSRALSQWMLLKTFRSFGSSDSFCDIGPGGGSTFQIARFLGLNLKMYAYEPDKFSIDSLLKLGIEVYGKSFNPQIDLPPVKFSAIIMSHVLEHFSISDAIAVLKKVKSMLLDDGIFLCEVPNTPMNDYGKMRCDDSPHLTFWTVTALQKAMLGAGMRPLFMSTVGEKYKDCWERKQRVNNEKLITIKAILKRIFLSPYCPNILFNTASYLNYILYHKTVYDAISTPDFKYGQDRTCIRVVCAI